MAGGSKVKALWASVQGSPDTMQKINGWLAIIWLIAAIPICLFLANSVPFLVFVSVYAVVTGHWSAWQAARTEVKQEEEAERREELHG
jgi:preprotein translocase subunit SecG